MRVPARRTGPSPAHGFAARPLQYGAACSLHSFASRRTTHGSDRVATSGCRARRPEPPAHRVRRVGEDRGGSPPGGASAHAGTARFTGAPQHRRVHLHREGRGRTQGAHRHPHAGGARRDPRHGRPVRRDHSRILLGSAPSGSTGVPEVRSPERGAAGPLRRPTQPQERPHDVDGPSGAPTQALRRHQPLRERAGDPPRGRSRRVEAERLFRGRLPRRIPGPAPGAELLRLLVDSRSRRREPNQRRRPAPAARREAPLRHRRRVPGREPDPGGDRLVAARSGRTGLRGGRRRPDHLPVARQRRQEHPHVQRPLSRGRPHPARRQLPLQRGDRPDGARLHRAEHGAPGEGHDAGRTADGRKGRRRSRPKSTMRSATSCGTARRRRTPRGGRTTSTPTPTRYGS